MGHRRGRRGHSLRAGDGGPTLVVLHGGIIDAAHVSWGPLIESLAERSTVYAPNLPGYGPSPVPDDPLTLGRHVRTAAGFLEALDLDCAVVAGISTGGGVAVGLGLDHPDRIEGLVALDALGRGSDLPSGALTWLLAKLQVTNTVSVELMRRSRAYVRFGLEQLYADANEVPEALVDLVYREAHRPDAGAAFRSFRAAEVTRRGTGRTSPTDCPSCPSPSG